MAPTLREIHRVYFIVAGNAMGLPDIPNRGTKVYFLSLRRCRPHVVHFGTANLCSELLNFSTQSGIFLLCSIAGVFRLQSSKTACIGTESGLEQLPGLFPRAAASLGTSSGVRSSTRAPVGSWGLGPSEARCAPLVRLLFLSDPDRAADVGLPGADCPPWSLT